MEYVVNKQLNLLCKLVNIRKVENSLVNFQSNKSIENYCLKSFKRMFTIFKQLVDTLFNNA